MKMISPVAPVKVKEYFAIQRVSLLGRRGVHIEISRCRELKVRYSTLSESFLTLTRLTYEIFMAAPRNVAFFTNCKTFVSHTPYQQGMMEGRQ